MVLLFRIRFLHHLFFGKVLKFRGNLNLTIFTENMDFVLFIFLNNLPLGHHFFWGASRVPPENKKIIKPNYANKSLGTMVMPAPTGASRHMPPPSWLLRALGRGTGAGWAAEGSLAVRLLMTDFSSFSTNLVT